MVLFGFQQAGGRDCSEKRGFPSSGAFSGARVAREQQF
jgi:hypothetical protein